ncbi:MAG: hypothetical protein U1D35_06190, partial [Paracoccaceae bacterium]|nr:hypothetical protein [Paracoccaceae bacterium]
DSVAAVANQGIVLLPFFLARRYLASAEALRAIVVALVLAGLAYSIPMLIEIRLSPQMNSWVYGYMQHNFFQTIRFGGYRPVVFLTHGLWVAFFALMTVLSALMLLRADPAKNRTRHMAVVIYLGLVLVLSKSAGTLVYALVFAPMILLLGRRWLFLLSAVIALVVITYPLLRGGHLVPIEAALRLAEGVGADRAYSLWFRFENEDQLLARANLRPWFGWGGYGRSLIYDPITGASASIADGAWIIALGIYGWLGYIAQFGLLALPLLKLGREALRQQADNLSLFAGAVALILAANLLDLVPNATLIPFTWLMAGALLGHAEALRSGRGKGVEDRPGRVSAPRPVRTVL